MTEENNVEIVEFLIENGADLEIQNDKKMTALQCATKSQASNVVDILTKTPTAPTRRYPINSLKSLHSPLVPEGNYIVDKSLERGKETESFALTIHL